MGRRGFWIVPRERATWIAHIKNNPNVGISCAQDSGTYRRITAQGNDVEHGPEYLVPTDDRPRYLIKIVPTKMLTWHGVEWARKYTEK